MRHHALRTEKCHGENTVAVLHQRRGFTRQRHQRINADIVRHAKRFALGVNEAAFERFARRKRNAVQEKINARNARFDLSEKGLQLRVIAGIARQNRDFNIGFYAQRLRQLFDTLAQTLALIIENQIRSGVRPRARDAPRDAALVRHAENQTGFAREYFFAHGVFRPSLFSRAPLKIVVVLQMQSRRK